VPGRRFDTCSPGQFLPTILCSSKILSRRTESLAVPGPGARQVHSRFPRAEDRVDELRYVASHAPATAAAATGSALLYFELHRPRVIFCAARNRGMAGGNHPPGRSPHDQPSASNLLRIRRLLGLCPVTSVTAEFPATGLQLALSQVTLPDFLGSHADITGS
jgi:hypothetical protein